jgi:hypothetical protein
MEIVELYGSAPRSGRGGRRFKSCHSDQLSDALIARAGRICGTKPADACARREDGLRQEHLRNDRTHGRCMPVRPWPAGEDRRRGLSATTACRDRSPVADSIGWPRAWGRRKIRQPRTSPRSEDQIVLPEAVVDADAVLVDARRGLRSRAAENRVSRQSDQLQGI